eukprot:scaffold7674_cov229-Pinguiococcus_pyrenoidosus.AAC.1
MRESPAEMSETRMAESVRGLLNDLVSPDAELRPRETLAALKRVLRRSPALCEASFYDALDLMSSSRKAQQRQYVVRLRLLKFMDELTLRSKAFRQLVVQNLSDMMRLCSEADHRSGAAAAERLQRLAMKCLEKWDALFSASYPQIRAVYRLYKEVKRAGYFREQERRDFAEREAGRRKVYGELRGEPPKLRTHVSCCAQGAEARAKYA